MDNFDLRSKLEDRFKLDTNVYIKLKIAQVGYKKISKCLAFHPAEFPICYPCKEGEEEEK